MERFFSLLLALLFITSPLCAQAQEIEEAANVPAGISKLDYQFLVEQKKKIDEAHDLLTKDISKFNFDCEKVSSSDAAKVESCTRQEELILARIDTYNRDLLRYQESIQRAKSKETKIIGFEKGTQNSAPVPVNLKFIEPNPQPEAQPVVLSEEEKGELKDTPGNIQAQWSPYQDKIFAKAKANAAWKLGFFLTEQGKYDESLQYFKEARSGFEEGSGEAMMVDRIIRDPKQLKPGPTPGFTIYKSRADALLDALQYGNRNWDASYTYLQVAHKANPNDNAVRDALNYFEALYASEKKDAERVSLGQIKPRK